VKIITAVNKRVLIIPDMHIPYHHPDALKFLTQVKDKYDDGSLLVINLGDECDKHAMSMHDSDSDLWSAGHELQKSIDYIHMPNGLHELFPKMDLLESNHGSMIFRRAKKHGIPLHYIKPYKEVLGTPKWSWHDELIVNTKMGGVYFCHGKTSAYGKLCKEQGISAVQGHFHGKFEITWHQSSIGHRFNMFSGCLVDERSMAMAYGKNFTAKPILGCSVLSKHGYPYLIKMNLNAKGRWDGRLS